MAILRYIIAIMAAYMLTSCYEDFDPGINAEPVLCLNSLITAGEPIKVDVSHTGMFDDENSIFNNDVKDAKITIFANEQVVEQSYLPKKGDRIRIVADSPTYGMATAEVTVPYPAPIENVKFTPTATKVWIGDKDFYHYEMLAQITFNLNIEMGIKDFPGIANYYKFGYGEKRDDLNNNESSTNQSLLMGIFNYDSEPIFKEHISVFETVMGNGDDIEFLFFTDKQFSGKTYTLHINFTDSDFRISSQKYDESLLECKIPLYLTTISQSYYNHAVYKWNIDNGVLGDMADIGFADPTWGYSNVSTGAGVVAAQSTANVTIDLTEFLKTTLNKKPK